jgi:subtilisin-like proprotein convertase family protein
VPAAPRRTTALLRPADLLRRPGEGVAHTWRGDLVIDLVAPDGSTYRLENSSNDSTDNVDTTHTDDASSGAASGTWKLRVQDVCSADIGYIDTWNLLT